jgi:hypothetical protein
MSSTWTAVDGLIRELGAIRRVAPRVSVHEYSRLALDRAIVEAAEAIDLTIDAPTSAQRLTAARDALGICEEMMLALDVQGARSLRARKRGDALRGRALELLEKARSLTTDQPSVSRST